MHRRDGRRVDGRRLRVCWGPRGFSTLRCVWGGRIGGEAVRVDCSREDRHLTDPDSDTA